MLWIALLPEPADASSPSSDALAGIASWALQFTPRVEIVLALCLVIVFVYLYILLVGF